MGDCASKQKKRAIVPIEQKENPNNNKQNPISQRNQKIDPPVEKENPNTINQNLISQENQNPGTSKITNNLTNCNTPFWF